MLTARYLLRTAMHNRGPHVCCVKITFEFNDYKRPLGSFPQKKSIQYFNINRKFVQLRIHVHLKFNCNLLWTLPYGSYPLHLIKFIPETDILFPCCNSQSVHLFGGGFTFHYTSHVMKRFIPYVYGARPLAVFENYSNLAENRIQCNTFCWQPEMEIPIFSLANQARPNLQNLSLNGFTECSFLLRNKEKAYPIQQQMWLSGGG